MKALANTTEYFVKSFNHNIPTLLIILAILWGIQLLNCAMQYRLNHLGIYPRNPKGLVGIVCAPFLHGSFGHLFINSIPLFILTNFVLIEGWPAFISVTLTIIFIAGLLTWIFARKSYHVGASGVIMGFWGYLLINAYYQQSMLAIVLAVVCLFYFGSMWLNIFPDKPSSSWEGHLFGLTAGVAASYLAPIVLMYLSRFTFFSHLIAHLR